MSAQRITISITNLLLVLATGCLLVLLWQLRSLLITVMISVVLAASISPAIDWAEKRKIPRWLGAILTYLLLISGFTGAILLIGPTVFDQIERIINQFPVYTETLEGIADRLFSRLSDNGSEWINQYFNMQAIAGWAFKSSQQVIVRSYSITRGIIGGIFTLVLSVFISGYMLADSRTLITSLVQLFPAPWNDRLEAQVKTVTNRMGGYIRGRFLVSAILGIIIATGLFFLGLADFALGLGAIAGVTNLIPFIGPILGAIPALIVAIVKGGWIFLWVLILFVIIQNLETYVLDPLLVGNSVGIHPLYQLLAVLGGVQLLGILGAILIPPWFAGTAALIENLYLKPKLEVEKKLAKDSIN